MERITSNATSGRLAGRWPLLASLAILALTLTAIPVAAGSGGQSDVAEARNAAAAFHDLSAAQAANYTADQLAAGRRADLVREAAGDVRMHASLLAAGENISGDQSRSEGGSRPIGRHRLTGLWAVLTGLIYYRRHTAALIDRRRSGISDGR